MTAVRAEGTSSPKCTQSGMATPMVRVGGGAGPGGGAPGPGFSYRPTSVHSSVPPDIVKASLPPVPLHGETGEDFSVNWATIGHPIMSSFKNPAWLPFSVSEAASAGDATGQDLESGQAWNHLLDTLRRSGEVVLSDAVPNDPVDMASGFRHLLVLLGVGIDELLRRGLDKVPAVKPSGMDAAYKWGMECPDCIYVGTALRGGSTYRLWGKRGSARYVGLQVMAGMGSTSNALIDDFELGPDGEFEIILSAEPHEGNWLPLDAGATTLVVRHFFYDWEHEVPVTMSIETLSGPPGLEEHTPVEPKTAMARQVIALGDFLEENLNFFLGFSNPEAPNTFLPPLDGTAMGAAAENRPVIGSWKLAPRRGPDHRGRAARRPVLELLVGEHLVGDGRLRESPVEPQRLSGRGGRRLEGPGGGGPRGSGRRQLARHRRAQRGADHPALRPHGHRPGADHQSGAVRPARPRSCRDTRRVSPSERAAAIDIRQKAVSRRFSR